MFVAFSVELRVGERLIETSILLLGMTRRLADNFFNALTTREASSFCSSVCQVIDYCKNKNSYELIFQNMISWMCQEIFHRRLLIYT
jgi:hypothetical protein